MFYKTTNEQQRTPSIKGDPAGGHPLSDYLYSILVTIIICVLIALGLYVIGLSSPLFATLILSLSYGISMSTLIFMLARFFKPEQEKPIKLIPLFIAAVVGGSIIGWYMALFILRYLFSYVISLSIYLYFHNAVMGLVIGGICSYLSYSMLRLKYTREAAERERINRLASDKEALEANLRLLQAQIEPHFLFNTLSNILSLIDTDPARGKSMLMDLISYLRTSLSRTLPETTTLGQEMEAVKAYLNIQRIRLGDRLNFTIKVPGNLEQQPFPPMLLQPLVENAVKHGLEPKVEGGSILITACENGDSIRIKVADTGLGISSFNPPGVGIANVRERIKLIYGEKGCLLLEQNQPEGVIAVIEVLKRDL